VYCPLQRGKYFVVLICNCPDKIVILVKYISKCSRRIINSNVRNNVVGINYFPKCFEKTFSISNFAPRLKTEISIMIIVPLKEGENIERALKKFKRKFEKTGVIRELRSRQAFIKPSVRRREEIKKAMYVQKMQESEE
jgi:small subunit ribosomal protein S21